MERDPHRKHFPREAMVSPTIQPSEVHTPSAAEASLPALPEGWSYGKIGGVLVRSHTPERLSSEEYIRREVQGSLAIGDPRTAKEIEAAVRQELTYQAQRYAQ